MTNNNKMGMKRIYLVAVNGDYQRYGWQQQHNVLCVDDIGYDMACELQNAGVDYDYNDVSGVYSVMDDGGKIIEQYHEIALVLTDEYGDEIARWDMDDQQFVAVQYITAAKENGTVEFNGKEYALTDIPFFESAIRRFFECVYYRCPAIDKDGNTYDVYWEMTDEYIKHAKKLTKEYCEENGKEYDEDHLMYDEDESWACDWDNPSSVTLIDRAEW